MKTPDTGFQSFTSCTRQVRDRSLTGLDNFVRRGYLIMLLLGLLVLSIGATASVKSVAKSLETKASGLITKAEKANVEAAAVLKRIPNDPGVRDLVNRISIDKLQTMITLFEQGQSPDDILRVVQLQRAGYENWVTSGGPTEVRTALLRFVGDLRDLADTVQRMRCFRSPEARISPFETNLMKRSINSTPDILLYGLDNSLNELVPNWPSAVDEVNKMLPIDAAAGLCANVHDAAILNVSNPLLLIDNPQGENFEMARCVALMAIPDSNHVRLKLAELALGKLTAELTVLAKSAREKVHLGLFGNVAAGAGATTGVRNPIKYLAVIAKRATEDAKTWVKYLQTERKVCAAEETRMENDLLACNMRFQYLHELGRFRIQNFYQRKVMPDSNQPYQMDDFRQLCTSYQQKICEKFEEGGATCS